MSLTATLSASGMRPASFLPAVKCSNCGDEIEIARMGEHICSSSQQHHYPSHQDQRQYQAQHDQQQYAAQEQYQYPPQRSTSPASNSYSSQSWSNTTQQNQSSASTAAPVWPKPPTATTFASSPLQHARSPSETVIHPPSLQPATTSSLRSARAPMPPRINPDAANKPFLAPSYPRSASPSSPVLSVRSGRSGSGNGSRPPFSRNHTMPSPFARPPSPELASNLDCAFPSFPTSTSRPSTSNGRKTPTDRSGSRAGDIGMEPRSPRSTGGESVMKRANTLKSGPFDAGRRKGSREEKGALAPPTPPVIPPVIPERQPPPEQQRMPPRKSSLHTEVPAFKNTPSEEPLEDRIEISAMPAALRIGDRSNTFPLPPGYEAPRSPAFTRTPSEPNMRGRRPSLAGSVRELPRTDLVRSTSRSAPRVDPRLQDAPPVPRPVQHHRQTSKHAPSDSSASSTSQPYSNTNSEGPSPISSAASSIDAFSPISQANALERDERPKSIGRPAGYSTRSQQQNPGLRAEQPAKRSPPPNFARPTLHSSTTGQPELTSPEHEQWPALAVPASDEYDPYKPLSPHAPRSRSKSMASEYSTYEPDPVSSIAPPPIPTNTVTRAGLQRRNTSVKPVCRGCNVVIEGKSVKAADGRLTGRWHKHCFTCRTCSQPFATADFYVINDQPYCKQHYHEKNGSVCTGCQRGIEGQYLETSSRGNDHKFHPACFTCCECRLILSNDYFEINGKVYCERHALVNKRGPPGAYNRPGYGGLHSSNRRELVAERRTTKLMMM